MSEGCNQRRGKRMSQREDEEQLWLLPEGLAWETVYLIQLSGFAGHGGACKNHHSVCQTWIVFILTSYGLKQNVFGFHWSVSHAKVKNKTKQNKTQQIKIGIQMLTVKIMFWGLLGAPFVFSAPIGVFNYPKEKEENTNFSALIHHHFLASSITQFGFAE